MSSTEDDIRARIQAELLVVQSVHGFLLEVLMAEMLAGAPLMVSDRFKALLETKSCSPHIRDGTCSSEEEQAEAVLAENVAAIARHIISRIAKREADLRAHRDPADSDPLRFSQFLFSRLRND